jgi:hypothetical protein
MINSKYKVWIEAEQWAEGEWDVYNGNTGVIVDFDDGTRWIATFITYTNIDKLVKKNTETGECLNGKYFWTSKMLLVDKISRESIEEVIMHLIIQDEFYDVFGKCFD